MMRATSCQGTGTDRQTLTRHDPQPMLTACHVSSSGSKAQGDKPREEQPEAEARPGNLLPGARSAPTHPPTPTLKFTHTSIAQPLRAHWHCLQMTSACPLALCAQCRSLRHDLLVRASDPPLHLDLAAMRHSWDTRGIPVHLPRDGAHRLLNTERSLSLRVRNGTVTVAPSWHSLA